MSADHLGKLHHAESSREWISEERARPEATVDLPEEP